MAYGGPVVEVLDESMLKAKDALVWEIPLLMDWIVAFVLPHCR